jgi:hypothetical protein
VIVALLWLAQIITVAARATAPATPPAVAQLAPAAVLQRYAAALAKLKEPHVISFDYTLEQSGARTLSQTHRVFRSGSDERDELLIFDGKPSRPPKVRIFRGRRNRYTVALLAPRVADYSFAYIGPVRDMHHVDYVFRLTPKATRSFAVRAVTIDGVRFLPVAIDFVTGANAGAGSIAFGSNGRWWVPYTATARATVATETSTERLTFSTYRFPPMLPPSTFTQARRLGSAPLTPPPATATRELHGEQSPATAQ